MKLANQKDLEQLALKQQEKQNDLTQEELTYLYECALEELEYLNKSTELYKSIISKSFLGTDVFSEPLTSVFFSSMDEMLNKFLPAILTGEYDTIQGYEVTDEECNNLRLHTYNNLRKLYLKEE